MSPIKRSFTILVVICLSNAPTFGQISFFNMPNPDMLPAVGYSYLEYDRYQSFKGMDSVNASVYRMSVQATKFLELGANIWQNADHPGDPNRAVLATKWRIWMHQSDKLDISMSPGSWTSIYLSEDQPVKNIFYDFVGMNFKHTQTIYTRVMVGGYGKYQKGQTSTYGMIAGLEQRLSKELVFVTDYFQGTGEGYGLAPGFVFYALDEGKNLPIYLAYQFDNESRDYDLILFEIGYLLKFWEPK